MNLESDRHDGDNRPFIWSSQELAMSRGMARYISTTHPIGVGIIENLENYIVEDGVDIMVTSRHNQQVEPELLKCCQGVIDEFMDGNNIKCDLDLEIVKRDAVDGENLIVLYPGLGKKRGKTLVRVVEPEQIVEPANPWDDTQLMEEFGYFGVDIEQETSWSWGIHSDKDDSNNIHGFAVRWDPSDAYCDYIPASMAVWKKANVVRNVKRGLSDFYPTWKWLRQQQTLLTNTGEGASELAAIAFIIQYANGTSDDVKSMLAAKATSAYSTRGANGQSIDRQFVKHPPGTKLNVPKGQEYQSGPLGAERGTAFLDVVDGLCRQIAVRWCMTEGMVSANDKNANMASSVEAGSRFWKFARKRQGRTKSIFREMGFKVVRNAYAAGRLSKWSYTWEQLVSLIDMRVTLPKIEVRDPLEVAQANQIRKQNGILSIPTWQAEDGLDPDIEKSHNAIDQTTQANPPGSSPDGSMANVKKNSPQSDMPTQQTDGPEKAKESDNGMGAYGQMSRAQWKKNMTGIKETLKAAAGGESSPVFAVTVLVNMGIPQDQAQELVDDAVKNSANRTDQQLTALSESVANNMSEFSMLAIEAIKCYP